ncbi:hypothetical protein TKWG_23345 [Advenella kashmirensis WT001]|uniref:Uncharacterized protein n=1 Tax=Advenella kashmirensis (strain DSM 17095 / LMG 22695 / WT001) TaxID=1036672 RepID=I3UGX8_ADVKW|nr:hypothetical protein TKWG_23345 [Advenella kashmirensis WT001]
MIKEKDGDTAELLRLRVEVGEAQKKQQELHAELEKRASLLAAHDQQNKELTSQLQSRASQLAMLEKQTAEQEQQRIEHAKEIETLKSEFEAYIQGLRALQEQQQRDNEQQLHTLIQKKMENLAPLQANQEKLDKLIEYRSDIEKIYSERTPLLKDLDSDQAAEQIQEKRAALEALNQQLAEFNNRQVFATVVDSSEGPSRPSHPK